MSDTDKAVRAAQQIQSRIEDATRKLETEMRVMKWPVEYRVIVWEALARRAMGLAAQAKDHPGRG